MESNSLTQIKERYKDTNLLIPVASEEQLNPFYKLTVMEVTPDLSENSGDIFPVGRIKAGENSWVDTYSPAKPLLMKLATAAGIQFDPNNTYGTRVSKNIYKAKAYGAVRLPDGTSKTHCDEKTIDLEDEEDRFRLEFLDKSIEGITDPKAAQEAARMFPGGEWLETTNKYGKACKAYKIADKDRQTYVDRSVMVNMTLLRKTAAEKAITGAILRVVRALTGLKGSYTKDELKKAFAVPRTTFSPDFSNPEVRATMLQQGMSSISNMFGQVPMLGLPASEPEVTPADIFSEEYADNPAFASDGDAYAPEAYADEPSSPADPVPEPVAQAPAAQEPQPAPKQTSIAAVVTVDETDGAECVQCGKAITEKVADYSINHFGEPLCYKCQKEARNG